MFERTPASDLALEQRWNDVLVAYDKEFHVTAHPLDTLQCKGDYEKAVACTRAKRIIVSQYQISFSMNSRSNITY